jgi:hypothetical protein
VNFRALLRRFASDVMTFLWLFNTTWQRERAAEGNSSDLRYSSPHSGQSSQLFPDSNHGNVQFLSNLAGAVEHKAQELHKVLRQPAVDNLRKANERLIVSFNSCATIIPLLFHQNVTILSLAFFTEG